MRKHDSLGKLGWDCDMHSIKICRLRQTYSSGEIPNLSALNFRLEEDPTSFYRHSFLNECMGKIVGNNPGRSSTGPLPSCSGKSHISVVAVHTRVAGKPPQNES